MASNSISSRNANVANTTQNIIINRKSKPSMLSFVNPMFLSFWRSCSLKVLYPYSINMKFPGKIHYELFLQSGEI